MVEIPGWDDGIYSSIKDISALVKAQLPNMTTGRTTPLVRQMSAAYLARVHRLIVAMEVLYEAGLPDVIGGVLRVCVEAWITGMWVFYTGSEAIDALEAEYLGRSNRLIKNAKLPVPSFEIIDPEASWVPHIERVTAAVEQHLLAEDNAEVGQLRWGVYDLVYGAESLRSIHAGYAAVDGHFDEHPDWIGVIVERNEGNDGSGKLLWAATLLSMLARRVFKEFGIGIDELDRLSEPIQRVAVELNEAAGSD
jgi:hypothetical protein